MDALGETGYKSEVAEFEVTNDNVSGVEVKAFLGASIVGVVVIEGADTAGRNLLQSITVHPRVIPPSNARVLMEERFAPARVNADGSFALKGLQAGSVSFSLESFSNALRIKRVERDGAEIKDAIDVRHGEQITGVRIVAFLAQCRIRGQVRIVGGALPGGRRLEVYAARQAPAGESKSSAGAPVFVEVTGWHGLVDEKGRFVIEGLPAGEYDLSITLAKQDAEGVWESVIPPVPTPGSNQHVTVRENAETPVMITFERRAGRRHQ